MSNDPTSPKLSQPALFDVADCHPYLRRQRAMRDFFATAAGQDHGLYLLTAVTGAGKNHVAADWAAGVVSRALCGQRDFDRDYIVVAIPQNNNCDEFRKKVKCRLKDKLAELGHPELASTEACRKAVVRVPSNKNCLKRWLREGEKRNELYKPGKGCPLLSQGDSEWSDKIQGLWDDAVKAFNELRRIEGLGLKRPLNKDNDDELDKSESKIRRALRDRCLDVARDGSPLVLADLFDDVAALQRLYPSTILSEPSEVPQIVILTPEKLGLPIDTIFGGSLSFYDQSVSSRSLFVFDEFDTLKSSMLRNYAERAMNNQPDDVIRAVGDRMRPGGSNAGGLVRGEVADWERTFAIAKKELGSAASIGDYKERDALSAAEQVKRSWGRLRETICAVYEDLRLSMTLRVDDGDKNLMNIGILLFGNDDIIVESSDGTKRSCSLVVDLTDPDANIIKSRSCDGRGRGSEGHEDQAEYPMELFLRRLQGAQGQLMRHLALCSRLHNKVFNGSPKHNMDRSIRNVVDALGIHSGASGDSDFWVNMVQREVNSRQIAFGEPGDESVYQRGAGYIFIDNGQDHVGTSYLKENDIPFYPEVQLGNLAAETVVVGMSATCTAPTVKNFSFDYLRDVLGVMPRVPELDELTEEILEETRKVNAGLSGAYDVEVGLISKHEPVVEYAGACSGLTATGACRSVDDVRPDAVSDARGVYDDDVFVERFLGTHDNGGVRGLFNELVSAVGPKLAALRVAQLTGYLEAFSHWAKGVTRGEHYAGCLLTPRSFAARMETGEIKLLRACAELMVENEMRLGKTPEFAGKSLWPDDQGPDDASARDFLVFLNAERWDGEWPDVEDRLASGFPRFLFASFNTAGFSKNLDYRIPEKMMLRELTRREERGYRGRSEEQRVDFDFLFIDNPTNRLSRGPAAGDAEGSKPAARLYAVAERTELSDGRGEISLGQRKADVKAILAGGYVDITRLRSARVEGARVVAQAVGRLSRTTNKMARVEIMLDPKLIGECDFGFLENQAVTYEMQGVLDTVSKAYEEADHETEAMISPNRLAVLDARRRAAHKRKLDAIMRPGSSDAALVEFDREREESLRAFNCPSASVLAAPFAGAGRRSLMMKSPYPCVGYAFARSDAKGYLIEWASRGEADTHAARRRLASRVSLLKDRGDWGGVREVSQAAARLDQIVSVPAVMNWFEENGYQTAAAADVMHMTPYEYQCVYLGALGEAAGLAILQDRLSSSWAFTRGEAGKAEIAGDFEVLTAAGEPTGVWIDMKHYLLSAYLRYGAGRATEDGLGEAERYREKAEKVGAKLVIAVNLLDDPETRGLFAELRGERLASVPCLIRDGEVDDQMVRRIDELIRSVQ